MTLNSLDPDRNVGVFCWRQMDTVHEVLEGLKSICNNSYDTQCRLTFDTRTGTVVDGEVV